MLRDKGNTLYCRNNFTHARGLSRFNGVFMITDVVYSLYKCHVLHLLCWHLLCYHLIMQCQLSCITTTLCSLVPSLSPLAVPLYTPPIRCICIFLERYMFSHFLQACQLWQALGCKCARCTSMRPYMLYRWAMLFTMLRGSCPHRQWR